MVITRVMLHYQNAQLQFSCKCGQKNRLEYCFSMDTVLLPDRFMHFYGYGVVEYTEREMTKVRVREGLLLRG